MSFYGLFKMDTLKDDTKIKGFVYRKRLLFDSRSGVADFTELKCENGSYGTLGTKYGSYKVVHGNGEIISENVQVKPVHSNATDILNNEEIKLIKCTDLDNKGGMGNKPVSSNNNVTEKETKDSIESDDKTKQHVLNVMNAVENDDRSNKKECTEVNHCETSSDVKVASTDTVEQDDYHLNDNANNEPACLTEDEYCHIEKIYRTSFQEKLATFENISTTRVKRKPPVYASQSHKKNRMVGKRSFVDEEACRSARKGLAGTNKTMCAFDKRDKVNGSELKHLHFNETFVRNGHLQNMQVKQICRSKSMPTLSEEEGIYSAMPGMNGNEDKRLKLLAQSSDDMSAIGTNVGEEFDSDFSISSISKSNWGSLFSKRLQQIRCRFESGCKYEKERAQQIKERLSKSIKNSPFGKRFVWKTSKDHKQDILSDDVAMDQDCSETNSNCNNSNFGDGQHFENVAIGIILVIEIIF